MLKYLSQICVALLGIVAMPLSAQSLSLDILESEIANGDLGSITSITVLQSGELVYSRQFDDQPADALRNTRSATKTITGALVGIAIGEGHISGLDATVASFFPDHSPANSDPRKSAMTLHDLITMTGPLECDDWNTFSRGNEERMYLVEDWSKFFLDLPIGAIPPWEDAAEDRPFGKRFSYCTAGVFTLGRIVEIATGRELEDYAREKLFDPIGVGAAQWPFNRLGEAQGGGGLALSGQDLARFGHLYLSGGMIAGEQVIPSQFVQASFVPSARVRPGMDYGYLWWLASVESGEFASDVWMMNGSGGNRVALIPELQSVVVVTSTNFRRRDAHEITDRIVTEHVVPALVAAQR